MPRIPSTRTPLNDAIVGAAGAGLRGILRFREPLPSF
jgi:hypothetical protein